MTATLLRENLSNRRVSDKCNWCVHYVHEPFEHRPALGASAKSANRGLEIHER